MTRRYPTAAAELAALLANSPDVGIADASGLNVGAPVAATSAGTPMLAAQSIVLPVPPSTNDNWHNYNGVTVLSTEAKNFRAGVKLLANIAGLRPFDGPVAVYVHFYADNALMDLDNYDGKALLDALQGVMYHNDRQIVERHSWKHTDKTNPRIEVEVRRIPS